MKTLNKLFLVLSLALIVSLPAQAVTIQSIGVGTTANDGTGDTLRAAMQKVNTNFTNLNTLATNHIFVGSSGAPVDVAMSGDATIDSTGALTIGANKISLSKMATQTTNTVLGNATSGTTVPTALAVGSCSAAGSALNWTTNTGFGCNTSISASVVPVSGLTGGGTGVTTFLATPSSSNLAAAVTDKTGSGALVFGTSPSITGGSYTAASSSFSVAAGVTGQVYQPIYKSGQFYLGGFYGGTITAANTTPLVDNTEYAMPGFAAAPITIKSLSFRTSSTSANIAASVKICVYAGDGVNSTPGTLLGSTASGTSVADAATTTDIKINLDTPAAVPAGIFYAVILQTSTTGLRFQEGVGAVTMAQVFGATSNVSVFAGTPVTLGWTVARTYSSGCVSPFGTAVSNTTPGLAPAFVFEIN